LRAGTVWHLFGAKVSGFWLLSVNVLITIE
jgi:hypothetical protein